MGNEIAGIEGVAGMRNDDARIQLEHVMARHDYSGSALIEVLHTAQQLYGYLSKPR